jgi:tetratricopeptide (TPR) repeat protein
MPQLDTEADYVRHFVGRVPCLGIVKDAMSGLQSRAQKTPLLSESNKLKVIWTCGLGGMGKSWLLRHIAWSVQSTHPNVKVCLVDWDDADWRSPLAGYPTTAEDLFNAIAERLAQLYGVDKLDGWWNASARVRAGSSLHRDLQIRMIHCERILAESGKDWRDSRRLLGPDGPDKRLAKDVSILELELQNASLWSDEPARLSERIRAFSRSQRDELFIAWAESILGQEATEEVVQPARFVTKAFGETLAALVADTPLLMILDTCELFGFAQEDLDNWLRLAVMPVLRDESSFLLVIGSRALPDDDTGRPASARWRNTVPQSKFKTMNLDEIAFTSGEIAALVRRAGLSGRLDEAAIDKIEKMTRGIPLAVALMLDDLRTKETATSSMLSFDDWAPPDLLNASDAARQTIRVMAKRFLQHLEGHAERVTDFADVMALGLLLKADFKVLRAYWSNLDVFRRLRELNRYALVSGNDLHLEVRGFVRAHWRKEPPAGLVEVATRLLGVVSNLADNTDRMDFPSLALERLNLASWISEREVPEKLCITIAIFYAAEKSTEAIGELISEFDGDHVDARDLLRMIEFGFGSFCPKERTIKALKRAQHLAATAHERASCALVCAMALTSLGVGTAAKAGYVDKRSLDLFEEAVGFFIDAINYFNDDLPHRSRVLRTLLEAAAYCVRDQRKVEVASRVYEILRRTGALDDAPPKFVSLVLSAMNQHAEAEAVLRRGIERDPTSDSCWHVLAHLLDVQHRHEEADKAFEEAAQLDSSDGGNWWCWACFKEGRKDWQGAERLYSRAIEAGRNTLETRVKLALVRLKQNPSQAALENLKSVIGSLDGTDSEISSLLNSVSWALYSIGTQLPLAKTLALRAHQLDINNLQVLHTLVAVLLRKKDWPEAEPYLVRMMEMTDPYAGKLNFEESVVPLVLDIAGLDVAKKASVFTRLERFPQWEEVVRSAERTPAVDPV